MISSKVKLEVGMRLRDDAGWYYIITGVKDGYFEVEGISSHDKRRHVYPYVLRHELRLYCELLPSSQLAVSAQDDTC